MSEVLDHFNVKVSPKDIFSRCQVSDHASKGCSVVIYVTDRLAFLRQVCNGNRYVIASPVEIKKAWHLNRSKKSAEMGIGRGFGRGRGYTRLAAKFSNLNPSVGSSQQASQSHSPSDTASAIEGDGINMETLTVGPNQVPLKLDGIPGQVISKVESFYVCVNCGKVFWEGSHFERVHEQFAHVLTNDDSAKEEKNVQNQLGLPS